MGGAEDILQTAREMESRERYAEARHAYQKAASLVFSYIKTAYEKEGNHRAADMIYELMTQVQMNLTDIESDRNCDTLPHARQK